MGRYDDGTYDSGTFDDPLAGLTRVSANLIPNGEFELNANGAINNSNATVARSTATANLGEAALLITSVAAGNWSAAILQEDGTTRIPVLPSRKYTFSAWLHSGAGVRSHRLQVSERDSGGGVTATNTGTDAALAAGVWTKRSITFTTNASTASVALLLVGSSAAAGGELFRADTLRLYRPLQGLTLTGVG